MLADALNGFRTGFLSLQEAAGLAAFDLGQGIPGHAGKAVVGVLNAAFLVGNHHRVFGFVGDQTEHAHLFAPLDFFGNVTQKSGVGDTTIHHHFGQ